MSNSKILMGAGALVLTAAGVFAGRASTKFANAPGLYYKNVSNVCTMITSALSTAKLTTGGAGTQATIKTSGGIGNIALFSDAACSATKAVHFKF
ncbi:MAG: hypothetical protein JST75_04420 [Bacteroidetes bacterium]|nr:hypothetical protein [Bacteroidota bacterium]